MGTEGAAITAKLPSIPIRTSTKIQNLERPEGSVPTSDPLLVHLTLLEKLLIALLIEVCHGDPRVGHLVSGPERASESDFALKVTAGLAGDRKFLSVHVVRRIGQQPVQNGKADR